MLPSDRVQVTAVEEGAVITNSKADALPRLFAPANCSQPKHCSAAGGCEGCEGTAGSNACIMHLQKFTIMTRLSHSGDIDGECLIQMQERHSRGRKRGEDSPRYLHDVRVHAT